MPDPADVKKHEAQLLNSYMERKDAVGLFTHLEELYLQHKDGTANVPEAQAWTEFVRDLTNNPTPEKDAFFQDIMKIYAERSAELAKEAGRKADDVREHIRNRETDGLELIAHDPKLVAAAGDRFTLYKTDIGRKLINLQAIAAPMKYALTSAYRDVSHIQNAYQVRYTELMEDPNLDPAARERYHGLNTEVSDTLNIESSMRAHAQNKDCQIDINADDGFVFSSMSDNLSMLKGMTDKELEDHIHTLEADQKAMKSHEKTLTDFGKNMKELGKTLKESASEEIQKTEEYKNLKKALSLCERIDGKSQQRFIDDSMNKAREAAEKFPDEKIRTEVLQGLANGKQAIEKSLSDGAGAVIQKNGQVAFSTSKIIGKDIARAKEEQDYRTLQNLPETQKEINSLRDKTNTATAEQDEIVSFKENARKVMRFTECATKDLGADKQRRNLQAKDRKDHEDYFSLTENTQALSEMDLDKLSPAQILEKACAAKAAADRYVQTHAGLSNITKGWFGDGRQRIANARNISSNLDKYIQELETSANSLEQKGGKNKTLAERYQELSAQKQAFRNEASAKRLDALSSPEKKIGDRLKKYQAENREHTKKREAGEQGTMPESASFVAAQSLRKLKNASNLENPFTENQKTAVLKYIGRVIAYDTQMYGPMKNKDEKGFKKFVGDVENNELFVKAVSETIGEVNQENVQKFCADPSMSRKIRDNFVRIRQEGLEKQENGLNRNNNQPQIDEANKNKNLGNKNPEAGI